MVSSLFQGPVVSAEAVPHNVDDQLFPEELAHVQRAVAKRRFEFGTARVCARQALAALGVSPVPLVPGPDRAPQWPSGIVGSISHTRDLCAVVVARTSCLRALGLDVETIRHLEAALARQIVTERELAFLRDQPPSRYDELLILHFSAKEAYYKCQYTLTAQFLGFHDVELEVDLAEQRFVARALRPLPGDVRELAGRFAFANGSVLCGVELEP